MLFGDLFLQMDKLLISAFSLLAGFLLTRLMDHVRGRDSQRGFSKSITLSLLPIAKALKKNTGFFEQAWPHGCQSLRGYFIAVREVVPSKDVKDFQARVYAEPNLKHRTLADLRTTAQTIQTVVQSHNQVRKIVELGDQWYADRETYLRLIKEAQRLVDQSLVALERLAPSDTRDEIHAFRKGGQ